MLIAALVFLSAVSAPKPPAANAESIVVPDDTDEYATFIRRAEAGEQNIDFLAMRCAYLKSAARLRARSTEINRLTKELDEGLKANDPARIRANAIKILDIVYIDLYAQKLLYQSCRVLHDDACASLHHDVETGLLKSVVATGDGKTCPTAWEVVRIDEEYFFLRMQGMTLKKQRTNTDKKYCDELHVVDEDGKDQTLFFDIGAMTSAMQRDFDGKR
jgi:hypothetical protein